jgi:hypothetical protein
MIRSADTGRRGLDALVAGAHPVTSALELIRQAGGVYELPL